MCKAALEVLRVLLQFSRSRLKLDSSYIAILPNAKILFVSLPAILTVYVECHQKTNVVEFPRNND
jgi:hypothetical protein